MDTSATHSVSGFVLKENNHSLGQESSHRKYDLNSLYEDSCRNGRATVKKGKNKFVNSHIMDSNNKKTNNNNNNNNNININNNNASISSGGANCNNKLKEMIKGI